MKDLLAGFLIQENVLSLKQNLCLRLFRYIGIEKIHWLRVWRIRHISQCIILILRDKVYSLIGQIRVIVAKWINGCKINKLTMHLDE